MTFPLSPTLMHRNYQQNLRRDFKDNILERKPMYIDRSSDTQLSNGFKIYYNPQSNGKYDAKSVGMHNVNKKLYEMDKQNKKNFAG